MTVQLAPDRFGARRRARPGRAHVIGVVSGRGGTGVSLLSALLALGSAQSGRRTLLVDADPWLDMQRVWLGLPKGRSLESLRASGAGPEQLVRPVSGALELASFGAGEAVERDHRALVRRVPSIFDDRVAVVVDAGSRLESLERCIDLRVGSILIVSGSDAIALASTHALLKAMLARADVGATVIFNRGEEDEVAAGAAVLVEGARRFLATETRVAGRLPEDPTVRGKLVDGATLPEALAGSALPRLVAELMPLLRPWQVA